MRSLLSQAFTTQSFRSHSEKIRKWLKEQDDAKKKKVDARMRKQDSSKQKKEADKQIEKEWKDIIDKHIKDAAIWEEEKKQWKTNRIPTKDRRSKPTRDKTKTAIKAEVYKRFGITSKVKEVVGDMAGDAMDNESGDETGEEIEIDSESNSDSD